MIDLAFDYAGQPERLLVDMADDPAVARFIEPADLEVITVTEGGQQFQIQALKRGAVRKVLDRIVAFLEGEGFDVEPLICGTGKGQFDYCGKHRALNRIELIKTLREFLSGKWMTAVLNGIGLLAPPISKILFCVSVLGAIDGALLKLCKCEAPR